jgi:hypothetical protein
VQKGIGEDEGDEGDRNGVELALLGFNCQAANRPLIPYDQPLVLRGNIGSGRYWFGVLPLYVGHLPTVGDHKNPEHLLRGTSLGIEYLRQGKYISGDERGVFRLATVNLPLPDARLRLFIRGKIGWKRDSLSR